MNWHNNNWHFSFRPSLSFFSTDDVLPSELFYSLTTSCIRFSLSMYSLVSFQTTDITVLRLTLHHLWPVCLFFSFSIIKLVSKIRATVFCVPFISIDLFVGKSHSFSTTTSVVSESVARGRYFPVSAGIICSSVFLNTISFRPLIAFNDINNNNSLKKKHAKGSKGKRKTSSLRMGTDRVNFGRTGGEDERGWDRDSWRKEKERISLAHL